MKIVIFFSKKRRWLVFPFFLFWALLTLPFYSILAQAMQSNSYKIPTDSLNVGGESSTSSSYNLGDTMGELGTGDSNSANYFMHAGFWQMQESYISISSPNDLALTNMGGINGGVSEGVMSWLVTTDNTAGYSMTIRTATIPALKSLEDSFDDYTPSGAAPDYSFSVPATTSVFGFSPEGTDVNSRFKDNGVSCSVGASETASACWDGLSVSPKDIATKATSNHPSGSTVNVRFRAASGANNIQTSGSYSASITVTALVL